MQNAKRSAADVEIYEVTSGRLLEIGVCLTAAAAAAMTQVLP